MSEELGDLVGGGLCQSHYHLQDPTVPHDMVVNYQRGKVQRSVSTNTSLTTNDDLLLVDTSTGNIAVTLPKSGASGKEFVLFKTSGINILTINPVGVDTINGAASLTLTAAFGSYWLKAVSGGWVAR